MGGSSSNDPPSWFASPAATASIAVSSHICCALCQFSLASWVLPVITPTEPSGVREGVSAVVGRAAATEMTLALVHGRLRTVGQWRCGAMACCSWCQALPGLNERAAEDRRGIALPTGPGADGGHCLCGMVLSAAWMWVEAVCSVMEVAARDEASKAATLEVAKVEGVEVLQEWIGGNAFCCTCGGGLPLPSLAAASGESRGASLRGIARIFTALARSSS